MQCYRERHALVPFIRSRPLEIVLDYLWDFRVTWNCSHKCCTSGFPVVKWQDLSWFGVLVVCGWHSNILLGCGSEISGTSSLECCCKQWLLCSLAILCKCTSPSLHFEITLKTYPANSMRCNSILAGQNLWGHGKSNFLTKEEKRRSPIYLSPTNNSTFTKIVSLGIDGFKYIRILGLRYIGKYWNIKPDKHLRDHGIARRRFCQFFFSLGSNPSRCEAIPKHLLLRGGMERRDQLSDQGPSPLPLELSWI